MQLVILLHHIIIMVNNNLLLLADRCMFTQLCLEWIINKEVGLRDKLPCRMEGP